MRRWKLLIQIVVSGVLAWGAAPRCMQAQNPELPARVPATTLDPGMLGTPTTLARVSAGSLLLRTAVPGVFLPAPALDTEIRLTVEGVAAEAEVRQTFRNPSEQWVEAVYAFPLPPNAAVDRLHLVVGGREIEGEIHERRQARRVFQQARRTGQRAALVEQQRPNLFTTEVSNLGPGEEVVVRIGFRQETRYDDGLFELRFPLTVAPRFTPSETTQGAAPQGAPDLASSDLACVNAAPRFAARDAPASVRLSLDVHAGMPLARLGSVSHAVEIHRRGDRYHVTLLDGAVPADRDFVFQWQPDARTEPEAALLREDFEGETYALLMLVPPQAPDTPPVAREAIFVVDVSGSMNGPSIRQAKAALDLALARLSPIDHFNVIAFAETAQALYTSSMPASSGEIEAARRWVAALQIRGGTLMRPALELALGSDGVDRGLRQVIFVTDGGVSNEQELFALIASRLGASRLFPVGIGSAPNSHFMSEAARFGRGTYTHIGSLQEVRSRMAALLRKLEQPLLRDVTLTWDDPNVEMWPAQIRDLYAGEPLVVTARLPSGATGVTLEAQRSGLPYQRRLEPPVPAVTPPAAARARGIARLWARRAIAALRDPTLGSDARKAAREAILALALRHHLVTELTSLVAVEHTPAAPAGAEPIRRAVPLPLPAGWADHPAIRTLPATATPYRLWLLAAALLMLCAGVLARGVREPSA